MIADPLVGKILNARYRVEEQLHSGSTSTIYRVTQIEFVRQCVAKVFNRDISWDLTAIKRTQQSAQIANYCDHPMIASVFEFHNTTTNQPYHILDLIKGRSLKAHVEHHGVLDLEVAFPVFIGLCDALEYLHQHGIVHRDLKPSHIMMTRDAAGKVAPIIIDFLFCKLRGQDGTFNDELDQPDELIGTPLFMSPEQCYASEISERTDIYGLGCLMYFALTGRPPFNFGDSADVIEMHKSSTPCTDNLPAGWSTIVLTAMQKDPKRRYQSMLEMKRAMESINLC